MMQIDEALRIVKSYCKKMPVETLELLNASGRVLAENVVTAIDMPSFDKSAMDGYACRRIDLGAVMEVIEEVPAGCLPLKRIGLNQCSKIMTGAPVPDGADVVVMKEFVEIIDRRHIKSLKESSKSNICLKGEDIKTGTVIFSSGQLICSEHIAVLAAVGRSVIKVFAQPNIGVLSTGSELVEPGCSIASSEVFNSNGYQLVASIGELGMRADYLGIVNDNAFELTCAFDRAFDKYDLLILSGGVSVGDFDLVPQVLKELGCSILIEAMAIKPGKHTLFGVSRRCSVLGLPGNPVSAYVQFGILGKTLIYGMVGHDFQCKRFSSKINDNYSRDRTSRFELLPVHINELGHVELLAYNGSAHIFSFTRASALLEVPMGVKGFKQGEEVYVRPL